jgi:hypothetical protein
VDIDTLEAFAATIVGARPGNDNNDSGAAPEPAVVRRLRRRPHATYASSGNVILPLKFAERMPGWSARAPDSR